MVTLLQACSQDFSWGGANLKNQDQIINSIINAMQVPKTHRGRKSNLLAIKLKSGNF